MHLTQSQRRVIAWVLLPVILIWLFNGCYTQALARTSVLLFWLVDLIQWIVLPGTLLIILAKWAALLPKNYGLDTTTLRWQSPVSGTLAAFITMKLAFSLTSKLAWQLLDHPKGVFDWTTVFPDGLLWPIVLLYSALTAGVVESIFFIGLPWLLYHNVRHAPSLPAFSLISSVVFAASHWEQGQPVVIGAFFSNLVACFWFFRLGTLWPVAAGHTLVDLALFWK
jgi:hypothetical protein